MGTPTRELGAMVGHHQPNITASAKCRHGKIVVSVARHKHVIRLHSDPGKELHIHHKAGLILVSGLAATDREPPPTAFAEYNRTCSWGHAEQQACRI